MIYKIIDNIYLSNALSARDLSNGSDFHIFRLTDSILEDNILSKDELMNIANDIYDYIEDHPNKNILICSENGSSRSVAVVMFYIIKKYNSNVYDSYKFIKMIKVNASPNNGFLYALNKYYYLKNNL